MAVNCTAGAIGSILPDAVDAAEPSCIATIPRRSGVDLERVGDVGEDKEPGGDVDQTIVLPLAGLYDDGDEEDACGAALKGS